MRALNATPIALKIREAQERMSAFRKYFFALLIKITTQSSKINKIYDCFDDKYSIKIDILVIMCYYKTNKTQEVYYGRAFKDANATR